MMSIVNRVLQNFTTRTVDMARGERMSTVTVVSMFFTMVTVDMEGLGYEERRGCQALGSPAPSRYCS